MDEHDIIAMPEEASASLAERNEPRAHNGHQPRAQARRAHGARWRDYTAFVLSGGGARGALQVGALRALLEYGITPDIVIGTSIGAWNGAWLARTPTLEHIDALATAWRSLSPERILLGTELPSSTIPRATRGARIITVARRLTSGAPSLYSDAGLQYVINTYLKDLTFEDLAVPLFIIATNLTSGERTIFNSGPIAPAVLASSAIPGIFPPVRCNGSVYVDGGALDNCSLETALAQGARRLFILDVGWDELSAGAALWTEDREPRKAHETHATRPARSSYAAHPLGAVLERTVQVISRYQLEQALQRLPRGIEAHVISSGMAGGGALEFDHAPRLIDRGYEMASTYLRERKPAPSRPREHAAPQPEEEEDARTTHTG